MRTRPESMKLKGADGSARGPPGAYQIHSCDSLISRQSRSSSTRWGRQKLITSGRASAQDPARQRTMAAEKTPFAVEAFLISAVTTARFGPTQTGTPAGYSGSLGPAQHKQFSWRAYL